MGIVFRAHDRKLDREVALKTISGIADDETIHRFIREARAAARLRHPGIVAVYDVQNVAGVLLMALELVEGESLEDRLDRKGPLSAQKAASLLRDLARAVETAHEGGVIHRDLKPANVLLEHDGRPRLTDFGLARDRKAAALGLTASGEALGTPCYMAPEQALAGTDQPIGPRTDVYGLGAILYESLTGRPPFDGGTALDVLRQVIDDPPERPSVRRARKRLPPLPADLETICLQCLEKEPRRRYASAAALAADLDGFLAGRSVAARRASVGERARRWIGRNRALTGSLLGMAVLAASTISLLLARTAPGAGSDAGASADAAAATLDAEASVRAARLAEERAVVERAFALARAGELGDEAQRQREVDRIAAVRSPDALAPLGDTLAGSADALERAWLAALGEVGLDAVAIDAIREAGRVDALPATHRRSHSRAILAFEGRALERIAARQREALGEPGRRALGLALDVCSRAAAGPQPLPGVGAALRRALAAAHDESLAARLASLLLDDPDAREDILAAVPRFGADGAYAEAILAVADRIDPVGASAGALHARALLRRAADDAAGAITDWDAALDRDPSFVPALRERCRLHADEGRFDDARRDVTRAIELDPADLEALLLLGRLERVARASDAAERVHDGIIELAPWEARGWVGRAHARLELHRPADALEDTSKALGLDDALIWTRIVRGEALLRLGRLEESVQEGEALIDLAPDEADAWALRGTARLHLRDGEGSIADFDRAIELEPGEALHWANRAGAGVLLERWADVKRDSTRALELRASLNAPFANRGMANAGLGLVAEAIADLEEYLRRVPSAPTRGNIEAIIARLRKQSGANR